MRLTDGDRPGRVGCSSTRLADAPGGVGPARGASRPGPRRRAASVRWRQKRDGSDSRYRRLPAPGPPLLVFTTSPAVEAAVTAEALGAAGFVTKPFDLDVLLDVVKRCVAARTAPLRQRPGAGCRNPRPGRPSPAEVTR